MGMEEREGKKSIKNCAAFQWMSVYENELSCIVSQARRGREERELSIDIMHVNLWRNF